MDIPQRTQSVEGMIMKGGFSLLQFRKAYFWGIISLFHISGCADSSDKYCDDLDLTTITYISEKYIGCRSRIYGLLEINQHASISPPNRPEMKYFFNSIDDDWIIGLSSACDGKHIRVDATIKKQNEQLYLDRITNINPYEKKQSSDDCVILRYLPPGLSD